jgi:hypothetical protein
MGLGSGVQVGRLGIDARRSARSVPRHLGTRSRPSTAPRRRNPAFGRGRLRSEEVPAQKKGQAHMLLFATMNTSTEEVWGIAAGVGSEEASGSKWW